MYHQNRRSRYRERLFRAALFCYTLLRRKRIRLAERTTAGCEGCPPLAGCETVREPDDPQPYHVDDNALVAYPTGIGPPLVVHTRWILAPRDSTLQGVPGGKNPEGKQRLPRDMIEPARICTSQMGRGRLASFVDPQTLRSAP